LRGIDARVGLGLLQATLAGEVFVVGHFTGQLFRLADRLAGETASGALFGFRLSHESPFFKYLDRADSTRIRTGADQRLRR
jgi:hypothetical protein